MINALLRKLSRWLRSKRIKPFILKIDDCLLRCGGQTYKKIHQILREKIRYMGMPTYKCTDHILSLPFSEQCWNFDSEISQNDPLVSVIVPNYNHAKYLEQRLESIYNQTYRNIEVILLDDASTDESRKILNSYYERYPSITTVNFNIRNSGHVCKQWEKGISLAKGKYIWIAESDDYCELNFLETLIPLLNYQSVMLAFCQCDFVQNEEKISSIPEYLNEVKDINWSQSFTMTANLIVKKIFGLKNIIPNVSGALFRNIGCIPEEVLAEWRCLRLCHDWIFYLYLIKGGCISYTNKTKNYYRIHSNSISLNIQKDYRYYIEHEHVSKYIARNYDVPNTLFEFEEKILNDHFYEHSDNEDPNIVRRYYRLDEITKEKSKRIPNIIMCCFSLQSGGGETFPIYLANEMRRQGKSVTLLDFKMDGYSPQIRNLLNTAVPLVEISDLKYLQLVITQLGGEIVHSHHASVDEMISTWMLRGHLKCTQIITLHGMYETLTENNCTDLLKKVSKTCAHFIYIADKNLIPFQRNGLLDKIQKTKLPNGLPEIVISPIPRDRLQIEANAFVLCIASRGFKEKGWEEAIQAVKLAQQRISRPIHLIILGDGEMRERLEAHVPNNIHFMGTVSNVRDYFALADAGILPTYFSGESYPLVLIECLLTHRPMIVTDIGETKSQLTDEDGNLAGELIPLHPFGIDVKEVAEIILKWATDTALYEQLKFRTYSAAKKFDIEQVVHSYLKIYELSGGH